MTDEIHHLPRFERNWKRPDDVPSSHSPHMWGQFTTKSRNGQSYKIRIQDITPDQYDEVWNMFKTYFYTGGELRISAKQIEDEIAMASEKWAIYQCLKENLSIIAVLDDHPSSKPIIVGGLLLAVVSKNDPPRPVLPGEARAKVHNLFKILYKDVDVFGKLNIDYHFDDFGLVVKPEYQRLGIGTELFKTVEKMAQAFKIPAIVCTFSNTSSQKLGAKLHYAILNEVKLSDYVDEKGRMILPTVNTKVIQAHYSKFL